MPDPLPSRIAAESLAPPAHGEPGGAGAWRALDASANRAGEGLRVLEEVFRFVLDDPHLTSLATRLRHDLADVLAADGLTGRVAMRDVAGDVGPGIGPVAALPRRSPADLVAANAARSQQALRSLQECALLLRPEFAPHFERLRYRLYDLERAALGVVRARDRLDGVTLCVLVAGGTDERAFTTLVGSLFEAGVRLIQLRDKSLPTAVLARRARQAVELARRHRQSGDAIVIVNDRPDVAVATGADGVHLGADDLSVEEARRVTGPMGVIGRTAHDVEEAHRAVVAGADYLGVGPCFPSSTKSFPVQAPADFLAAVGATIGLPTFAIGGVTVERLEALAGFGLTRVAVAAAVTGAADPARAAAEFIARLAVRRDPIPPTRPAAPL
jgi:thiamine-phosphate pyrophosphorylase